MAKPKVEVQIEVYEVNGSDKEVLIKGPKLKVDSHWSRRNMVVVSIGDTSFTVVASDLQEAIKACTL